MIEPIRGHIDAYDLSCASCGVIERFAGMRFDRFIVRARANGWMIGTPRAARDCLCVECVGEASRRAA